MSIDQAPTKIYPAVNRCIYCGETAKKLTDEHSVPFALGGNLILPESSCLECAKAIHGYEMKTLQTTLGTVRRRLGIQTRKKAKQKSEIEIGVIRQNGSTGRLKVPVTEYPVGVALPGYNSRANIFYGAPSNLDTLGHIAQNFYLNGDLNGFKKKYNWDGLIKLQWLPVEFAQSITKICYAFAVAELGIDAFKPICLDHILKKDPNISHVFGQNGVNKIKDGKQNVWDLSFALNMSATGVLLVVYCSIFAAGGTPIYEVAVGRIEDRRHLELWAEKLKSKQWTIQIPTEFPTVAPPSNRGA